MTTEEILDLIPPEKRIVLTLEEREPWQSED